MIDRILSLSSILKKDRSAFLLGPRGVGKTCLSRTFIKEFAPGFEIDLLSHELFQRYSTQPHLFRKEIEDKIPLKGRLTVFIDEIQRIPALLNEVHSLLESRKTKVRFLMTGSSARKLKRRGVNLLAGRAWTLKLHPLTHRECALDLNRALQFGTLPSVYLDDPAPERTIKSYVETYLKEEIMQEALVRRVEGFIRFLEIAGQMNGEPLNFRGIGRDCGVSTKTVQEFSSILVDTLVAFRIDGWSYSIRKQIRRSPKVYFFDCGVLNGIRGELKTELKEGSYRYGKLFETFVIQEMIRLNDYYETDYRLFYWMTNTGLEVDLILSRGPSSRPIAIEIKSSRSPEKKDLTALKSFKSENPKAVLYCFCRTPRSYKYGDILVLPWEDGFRKIFVEEY